MAAKLTPAAMLIESLLNVDEIDANTFQSTWLLRPGARAVFGGHILALALVRCRTQLLLFVSVLIGHVPRTPKQCRPLMEVALCCRLLLRVFPPAGVLARPHTASTDSSSRPVTTPSLSSSRYAVCAATWAVLQLATLLPSPPRMPSLRR